MLMWQTARTRQHLYRQPWALVMKATGKRRGRAPRPSRRLRAIACWCQ